MSIESVINNFDISKITSPSGLTYGQELVKAAQLLRNCIDNEIHQATMHNCLSSPDLVDIRIEGSTLSVDINVLKTAYRNSVFYPHITTQANVFWLLNDGFTVKKNVWFKDIKNFGHREGARFVQKGIEKFNASNNLGIKIEIERPDAYYGLSY